MNQQSEKDRFKNALMDLREIGYFTSLAPMCHCKMPISSYEEWNTLGQMRGKTCPLARQALGDCSDCLLPKMPEDCWRRAVLVEYAEAFSEHGGLLDEVYISWTGDLHQIKTIFCQFGFLLIEVEEMQGLMEVRAQGPIPCASNPARTGNRFLQ
jgi:hypothetical protein